MMPLPLPLNIEHQPSLSSFQVAIEGRLCVANYRMTPGVMHLTHTEVPAPLAGRGIAAALVQAALAHARAQGLKVNPVCSYVRAYMHRHPEAMELRT